MEAGPELSASSITKSNSDNNREKPHPLSPTRAITGCGSSEYVELEDDNTYGYLDVAAYSGLTSSYSGQRSANTSDSVPPLTAEEILKLHELLRRWDPTRNRGIDPDSKTWSTTSESTSADSDYPEFGQSTHAWAVFADNPKKRATRGDRLVGCFIISFQLFAYRLFAMEAIEDFQAGTVTVLISHSDCVDYIQDGDNLLQCRADYSNTTDAFVAYMMLGIFLCKDFLQAINAISMAPFGPSLFFACFAGVEVVCAFVAAAIAVSYHLFIGNVTDAVEVGVGLLFIRELSQRTYSAIRYGNRRQYHNFFVCLAILLIIGMAIDPLAAKLFAGYIQ